MQQTIGTPEPTNVKKHYHLIAAELVFKPRDLDTISAVRMNGVIAEPEKEITQRQLAKAQQIIQLNFHRKIEEESNNVNVLDCVLMNFIYLGYMTQEEFFKKPEGMELRERQEPTLKAVSSLETAVEEAGQPANDET